MMLSRFAEYGGDTSFVLNRDSNRIDAAGLAELQVWVSNLDGTGLRQMGLGSRGTAVGAPEWGRR